MILTREQHFERLNAWRNDRADPGAYKFDFNSLVGQKWEIEEATYWYFLEVLPPLGMRGGSFYMSEFLTDDITSRYSKVGKHYFHEYVRAPLAVQLEQEA